MGRVPLPGASGLQQPERDVHRDQRDPGGSSTLIQYHSKINQKKTRVDKQFFFLIVINRIVFIVNCD